MIMSGFCFHTNLISHSDYLSYTSKEMKSGLIESTSKFNEKLEFPI